MSFFELPHEESMHSLWLLRDVSWLSQSNALPEDIACFEKETPQSPPIPLPWRTWQSAVHQHLVCSFAPDFGSPEYLWDGICEFVRCIYRVKLTCMGSPLSEQSFCALVIATYKDFN